MSIKQLEEIKDDYHKRVGGTTIKHEDLYIKQFMQRTITTFKEQSDMIADLRQELAQKQDAIDINNIKEVRNLNGEQRYPEIEE